MSCIPWDKEDFDHAEYLQAFELCWKEAGNLNSEVDDGEISESTPRKKRLTKHSTNTRTNEPSGTASDEDAASFTLLEDYSDDSDDSEIRPRKRSVKKKNRLH